ncbi:MAG: radical SAM protein, partial [Victivallales bacterium]|nr:radical SAM protein [Victivallales bacterium]
MTMPFSTMVVDALLEKEIEIDDLIINNIITLEQHWRKVEFELKFEITNNCNLNCEFCFQKFGRPQKKVEYFCLSKFQNIINLAKEEKQIKWIRITGGEPMLHPDCLSFLECAKNAGMRTILNTNGTLLNTKILKEYKSFVDIWKISLPSYDVDNMDDITGRKNTWSDKINALELLKQENAVVDILVVLCHNNILHLDDFISINKQYSKFFMTFLRQESNVIHRTPLTNDDLRRLVNYMI